MATQDSATNGHDFGHAAAMKEGSQNGTQLNNGNFLPTHDYDGNPLAHQYTGASARLPAFAGYLQPGAYRPPKKDIANPAPLGLFAFALTTFVLSLINVHARHVAEPNIVVALAYGYGGLVQLLAGMWEMAAGNTFGATALSSYGGFWLSFAIVLTPGGFGIVDAYSSSDSPNAFDQAFSFFLFGWFIFTFIIWLCTLRSTVVFCSLFLSLWITFLLLGISYAMTPNVQGGVPNVPLQKAGGWFGLIAAFLAWYVGFAGLADNTNSFFTVPVMHFPWSAKGRENRGKEPRETV